MAERITRRMRCARGGTLVEVMIGVLLFWMTIITVVLAMTHAYRLTAQVRYRDQARFILASASDQFLRASYRLQDNSIRTVFGTSATETGTGLCWHTSLNIFALPFDSGATPGYLLEGTALSGLVVPLGDPAATTVVNATLWRRVEMINANTGLPSGATIGAAGFLLRGDFRITFNFLGRDYQQATTVLRVVPQ